MLDNLTQSSQSVVINAQEIAKEYSNSFIEPLHILYAISLSSESSAADLMNDLKLNTMLFKDDIKAAINNLAKVSMEISLEDQVSHILFILCKLHLLLLTWI